MIDRLVGIPYLDHGRDYDGADCWGLVYLFYRDILKTPVPSYSDEMARRGMGCADYAPLIAAETRCNWRQVGGPDHGAVALLRNGRYPTHVGIMLDGRRLLHTEGAAGSRIQPVTSLALTRRICGFYRLNNAD